MFLTRAERRRRRWRRRLFLFLAALLTLIAWAAAQNQPRPHGRHRIPATHHAKPPISGMNGLRKPSRTVTAKPVLTWVNFHGIVLPVSAQDGPRHTRVGLAWGFTDTRRGALLAAVNIAVRTAAQWGPAVYQPTIRNQVTGPGTAALLRGDASGYAALRAAAHVPPGQPAGRGYAAEVAYRYLDWSPTGAMVAIVTEGPGVGASTVTVATRIEVVWRHGDWRVVAPPSGDWGNSATAISSSLTGYTPFPNGS